MERKGVDIILPVYNALKYLKDCFASILKYTDLSKDRLVIIDDCSPDPEVWEWIHKIDVTGVKILKNEKNLGFSGTVNRGIRESDRDVILLNSDTIVTSRWIEKMVECAYSSSCIGTVTPFSNAATLCSVPVFCVDNQLPENSSIDEYAQIIEDVSQKRYPEITVAVGFCMYIKRSLINEIGYFDAETFQKGYGEENDFCWRASQLGYKHSLCDNTFIYHRGVASFVAEEKRQLVCEHLKILDDRYPLLSRANDIFVAKDKNQDLRHIIELFSSLNKKKKTILYILHTDYHDGANQVIGGTELHVKSLEGKMIADYNIIVAARYKDQLIITITTSDIQQKIFVKIGEKSNYFTFSNETLKQIWELLIDAFGVFLVHIHHIEGLSFDIFDVSKKKDVPVIVTLHDYYSVCPTTKLVDCDGVYCVVRNDPEKCKRCLRKQCNINRVDNYIEIWRDKWIKHLLDVNQIVVPSFAAKEIITSQYTELDNKIKVLAHGTEWRETIQWKTQTSNGKDDERKCDIKVIESNENHINIRCIVTKFDSLSENVILMAKDQRNHYFPVPVILAYENVTQCIYTARLPRQYMQDGIAKLSIIEFINTGKRIIATGELEITGGKKDLKESLNIATIGGISNEKGASLLCETIPKCNKDIHWFVFGETNSDQLKQLKEVYISGTYKKELLSAFVDAYKIDVICLLAIWPETYSYVLSEAWEMGTPVIGLDIGAIGDRIRENNAGWLVKKESAKDELPKLINRLKKKPEEVAEKKRAIRNVEKRTVDDMIVDYQNLYKHIGIERKSNRVLWPVVASCISESEKRNTEQYVTTSEQDYITMYDTLRARENELKIIKATKGYRVLEWARHIYLHAIGKE